MVKEQFDYILRELKLSLIFSGIEQTSFIVQGKNSSVQEALTCAQQAQNWLRNDDSFDVFYSYKKLRINRRPYATTKKIRPWSWINELYLFILRNTIGLCKYWNILVPRSWKSCLYLQTTCKESAEFACLYSKDVNLESHELTKLQITSVRALAEILNYNYVPWGRYYNNYP